MSCINPEYLEKIIIKSLMEDKNFCVLMSSVAEKRYFESSVSSEMFQIIKDHHEKFMDLPNKDIIINSSTKPKEVEKYIKDIEELEPSNDLFLYEQSENWLKESAFKYAIMDSVDLVKKKEDINKAREYIECALTKTLKKQIGLDYWGDISERLKRMFSAENERIPTYYPQLDEFMNGGLPPYTLSVIVAAMHNGKSNLMVNMAARQMMKGHNVIYLSLEMAEDELAKRVDAQLTKLDINRIYDTKKKEFLSSIKSVKTGNEGRMMLKQFPTGTASVNDFRSYLYELQMRDISIDCIYVDYLNIMKPTTSSGDGNLYTDVKKIGEELRALTYIFKCPCVTATQTTRGGINAQIGEISFAMLSESIGTAATADFIMVLGQDSDSLVYENELFYKILKNRLGGRVGEISKFYNDSKSLKMYDSTELDEWIEDAKISGATRNITNN